MGRLTGKVAIVTGAAAGLGRATTVLFAQEDAKVVLADIDEPAAAPVVAEVQAAGGEGTFVRLDVSDEADWQHAVAATLNTYGKLNVLVNNAGIALRPDVEDTTLAEYEEVMRVNATGVFLGMKYAIGAMKDSGDSCSIINRSSIMGLVAEADEFAYCASKGAVTLMTKSAALAMGAKGYPIRVNSVHPGYINTPMFEQEAHDRGVSLEQFLQDLAARHPIGSVGEPIDVAYLDLYLASDESRWVTGAAFTIDGGYTAK